MTARGNRREPIVFEDGDQEIYSDILAEQMRRASVEAWACCLTPNHVHLILCPRTEVGMAQPMGAAHRRRASFVNARGRWPGHLFDGRYASFVMDEAHLMAAVRYVALNPVRARLAERARKGGRNGDTPSFSTINKSNFDKGGVPSVDRI